ncbi:unnamed protein product, partial [marine sediment metagenome]
MPVVVNQVDAVTTFKWTGDSAPVSYDADLFVTSALNSGPGTLFLGLSSSSISNGGRVLNATTAYLDEGFAIGLIAGVSGFSAPISYTAGAPTTVPVNPDSGTTIVSGDAALDLPFTSTINSY